MEAGNLAHCSSCHSTNRDTFNAEIAIHFPGLKGLNKPIVWVFPKLLVCLNCGCSEFTVPEKELIALQTGEPVEGAVVHWRSQGDNHNRSNN